MQRLTGLDASLLYMETPTLHMHTLKVALFDPGSGARGFSLEGARRQLGERLHYLPSFRRRLVEVPFGFHHPVWIEDPDFDLESHVHGIRVPAPGGRREVDAAVSRIAGDPLDRDRPLWEIWFLEGLEEGRVGAVIKIHHALADGVAAANLLSHALGPIPEVGASTPSAPSPAAWVPEPIPSASRLLLDALIDHARQIARLPELVYRTLRNVWALIRHRGGASPSSSTSTSATTSTSISPPAPILDSPKTLFNTSLTARRVFATGVLSLDELKTVKTTFGVTFNDVVLALMAGSVRGYLERRDALPDRALTVEVPIATDIGGDEPRLAGNRLSSMVASLCTDVADPVERLRAIHDVTRAAKEHHDLLGSNLMEDWLQYVPPRPFAWVMRNYAQKIAERFSPAFSVIASSVPGPRKELYWKRTRLIDLYSVGPILEGVGLNVTMWSYGDRVYVGAIACPDRLPDLDEIIEGIDASLAALLAAARHETPSPATSEAPT